MAFPFLQRGTLAEHARQLKLEQYVPDIQLEGLLTGVDNVRTDVYLSQRFTDIARQHILRLLARFGSIEDFLVEEFSTLSAAAAPRHGGFVGSPPPPAVKTNKLSADPADFKKLFADLLTGALQAAKANENISVDLLARIAVLKFLRTELAAQYGQLLERGRTKLKAYDSPRAPITPKAVQMRERFAGFQVNKKIVMRKAGQDLFSTLREIEKETLARTRRSYFGEAAAGSYDLFINRLLFTEDGHDDYVNAEHYVMLGNYERDADKFQTMQEIAVDFLKSLAIVKGPEMDRKLDAMLSVSQNAQELMAGGTPDDSPKGRAQKALLTGFVERLERAGVMENIIASYEVVKLLDQYSPPINPQQLKNSLISRTERKRVERLLEEQGKISADALNSGVKRVESCRGSERAKVAGRYLVDFMRYHRDLRRFEALLSSMDGVNVITNEKLRELSAINNTLYEFMLSDERKSADTSVVGHVIMKSDIRDSTTLTRTLFERGLNPASYFSLNFFDPVNKLLPKYDATKVFIEGDAVILALFERQGEQNCPVGRTCMLAKEMIQVVSAYNVQSRKAGLPIIELGLGICYQDSAPMYLMDGNHRIMISKALNESDRLSGCSKASRNLLGDARGSLFNVYCFQTVEDAETGGIPEEFLMRFNVGGIHINAAAFQKLQQEISLRAHELELPMIWGKQKVKLYSGLVPVAQGIFHEIVVREGIIAHIETRDFSLKRWTEKKYYEVCVNQTVYDFVSRGAAKAGA